MTTTNNNKDSKTQSSREDNKTYHLSVNTHEHIDYGGDDCEHSLVKSKTLTPEQRKLRYLMYRGD